jgi:hypothetical protein
MEVVRERKCRSVAGISVWLETVRLMWRTMLRRVDRVRRMSRFFVSAYNLVRMREFFWATG